MIMWMQCEERGKNGLTRLNEKEKEEEATKQAAATMFSVRHHIAICFFTCTCMLDQDRALGWNLRNDLPGQEMLSGMNLAVICLSSCL